MFNDNKIKELEKKNQELTQVLRNASVKYNKLENDYNDLINDYNLLTNDLKKLKRKIRKDSFISKITNIFSK